MSWKLRHVSLKPSGKLEEYYIDDATGDVLNVETDNVEALIDRNNKMRTLGDKGWSRGKLFRRKSSIPLSLAEKWRREDGLDVLNPGHSRDVERRISDPDYSKLRTR